MNDKLSCERAQGVVDYLVAKGIPSSRLIMSCKGETQPRYNNNTDLGKSLNRRVEIKIGGGLEEYEKKKTETDLAVTPETKLLTNFPNPFSESTTIEAYIKPEVKNAQIVVTDLNGKTIKTIFLLEKGKTSTYLDGTSLTNGTYVATLVTDNKVVESIKLVVAH